MVQHSFGKIRTILQKGLNFFIPFENTCACCEQYSKQSVCKKCVDALPINLNACDYCAEPLPIKSHPRCGRCILKRLAFERAYAPFIYAKPLDALVKRLKYANDLTVLHAVDALLKLQIDLRYFDNTIDAIIPMPIPKGRLGKRGFNQAHELAKLLSKHTDLPVIWDRCFRLGERVPQSQCTRSRRLQNVRPFDFKITLPDSIKHVVIVDDVITTGASIQAFAMALKKHGVLKIQAWALCKTPAN